MAVDAEVITMLKGLVTTKLRDLYSRTNDILENRQVDRGNLPREHPIMQFQHHSGNAMQATQSFAGVLETQLMDEGGVLSY